MPATPKKIPRRRPRGEVTVEQTRDPAAIAAMLDKAGTAAPADFNSAVCFLIAYLGDDPVGIAGLATEIDAALIRPLFVLENMRRRGVGASLVRAARMAAHTRGGRTLYATAPALLVDYFTHLGFVHVRFAEIAKTFGKVPRLLTKGSDEVPACGAVRLDISRDGLVER
jgi:N-acetylglutamate synthase-like GNAT family acetyltransferase